MLQRVVAPPRNLNLHTGLIMSLGDEGYENNLADGGAHENSSGIAVSSCGLSPNPCDTALSFTLGQTGFQLRRNFYCNL